MGEIIGVVSGKGGVGKTTLAANLGLALMEFDETSIVVDADLGGANLGLQLGQYRFSSTLNQALKDEVSLNHIITIDPSGLRMIPASISPTIVDFDAKKLRKKLENLYDLILIDSPPGLDQHARKVMKICDSVLIVVIPELTSVADGVKIKHVAEDFGKDVKGVVLNRVGYSKYDLTTEEIKAGFDLPVVGKIPEDKNLRKSFFRKEPLLAMNPYSRASLAYKEIAAELLKKQYRSPKSAFLKRVWYRFR